MSDESSENYFTPCSPKLIERAKLTIARIANGDRVILKDFNKFWQNINIKQELFDHFLSCLAETENKISSYGAAIMLLLICSKKLNDSNLKCINTIFKRVNDDDFTAIKDICVQDSSSLIRFFMIWLQNMHKNQILPILSVLLYPELIRKGDPFLPLQQLATESDYFQIILQFTLLFRTTSEGNLKQTYYNFSKDFKDPYFNQYIQVSAMLLSELNIPYSNAALYNYDVIKCSNISHTLYLPFQLSKFFLNIEVFSNVNKYQSIYSLIDNIYYEKFKDENISPNPDFLSELFGKLIFYCENAYVEFSNEDVDLNSLPIMDNSELWAFFKSKSIPRTSEPKIFTPLMYPFEPVGLPNEVFISFSTIKINGVPLLLSGSSQNSFDKLKQGTKSNFYAAVVGGAIEMMHVLLDYVNILFEPKNSMKKDLFILPILNEESRFSKFLNENDVWVRHNCGEFIKLIFHIFPEASNNAVDSTMPFFEPDAITCYPNDFWTESISPFSIFYRFLSFYCGCSSYTTKFAVWIAYLTNKKHQVYAVPFIDSVILRQCTLNGSISFNITSPYDNGKQNNTESYRFNNVPSDVRILNMSLPSENCYPCLPEDNSLILDANNLINETSLAGPLLVSSLSIKSVSNEFYNLDIDSVRFTGIKSLKVERLSKDSENVYLSVRHFSPLKNGFQ